MLICNICNYFRYSASCVFLIVYHYILTIHSVYCFSPCPFLFSHNPSRYLFSSRLLPIFNNPFFLFFSYISFSYFLFFSVWLNFRIIHSYSNFSGGQIPLLDNTILYSFFFLNSLLQFTNICFYDRPFPFSENSFFFYFLLLQYHDNPVLFFFSCLIVCFYFLSGTT